MTRKCRQGGLGAVALILLVVAAGRGSAQFQRKWDLSLGPYEGGHGWSYAESYGYGFPFNPLAVPWTAVYPYSLPYYSPRVQGPWNNPALYYRYGAGRYGPYAQGLGNYAPAPAMINLQCPPDCQVWVDGSPTQQTGGQRQFVSPPLNPGQNYVYVLRVRWLENGRAMEQMETVNVQGGERVQMQFPH
jgi:uncharacterized protein (TIGR03000 family)